MLDKRFPVYLDLDGLELGDSGVTWPTLKVREVGYIKDRVLKVTWEVRLRDEAPWIDQPRNTPVTEEVNEWDLRVLSFLSRKTGRTFRAVQLKVAEFCSGDYERKWIWQSLVKLEKRGDIEKVVTYRRLR
jgi:hypothetical protein